MQLREIAERPSTVGSGTGGGSRPRRPARSTEACADLGRREEVPARQLALSERARQQPEVIIEWTGEIREEGSLSGVRRQPLIEQRRQLAVADTRNWRGHMRGEAERRRHSRAIRPEVSEERFQVPWDRIQTIALTLGERDRRPCS